MKRDGNVPALLFQYLAGRGVEARGEERKGAAKPGLSSDEFGWPLQPSRGRAKLAGRFPELEEELGGLAIAGFYRGPGRSPDRADAMVWALTELMLGPGTPEPRVRGLG